MSAPPQNFPDKLIRGIWLRAFSKERTPELDAALKEVGIDLTQPLLPSYPRSVWFPALQRTAALLFPAAAPEAAMRQLGQKLIDGLESQGTYNGPAFSMVRFLGPKRILKDIGPRIAGLGLGIEQEVHEISSKELDIQLNEGEGAPFVGGALERLVNLMGGRSPSVEIGPGPRGSRLRVRWS
jgi:uncharacterized protein (TIGR02265 family)